MPRRFRREATSLAAALAAIEAEYGRDVRIVAADAVTVGGFRGLFARHYFDIEFEVPDPEPIPAPAPAGGIDALLDAADDAERHWHPPTAHGRAPGAAPSTERPEFDDLLAELAEATTGARRRSIVPEPRAATGGLIMVIGAGPDAWEQARTLSAHCGGIIAQAGTHERPDIPRADDRRHLRRMLADAVIAGSCVVLAAGLPATVPVSPDRLAALAEIPADQVWLVVDATRKADDTARWAAAIGAALPVDALAVIHVAATATPQSVDELLIPIGWLDGRPSSRPRLG